LEIPSFVSPALSPESVPDSGPRPPAAPAPFPGGGNGEKWTDSRNEYEVRLAGLRDVSTEEGVENDSPVSILDNCVDGGANLRGAILEPGRTQRWLCSIWEVREDPKAA